jgi:hypothetical protein
VHRTSSQDPAKQEKLQRYIDLCHALARCEEEKEKLIRSANSAVKYLERQLAHLDTQLQGWANVEPASVEGGLRLETTHVREQVVMQLASTRAAQQYIVEGALQTAERGMT